MDRLKKRRLRENPEFREKEKQEAKGRMRALRSDPTYRYYLQKLKTTTRPFRSNLLSKQIYSHAPRVSTPFGQSSLCN